MRPSRSCKACTIKRMLSAVRAPRAFRVLGKFYGKHFQNDFAFLLYPARWFPVNDYTVDRFTSEITVTVNSNASGTSARSFAGSVR